MFLSLLAALPGWDLISLWKQMGWFSRTVVITLACMAANVAGVMILCTLRYAAAVRATRKFLRDASAPVREHDLDRVLVVANSYPASPLATASACAIEAFRAAIESPWKDSAPEIASHAVDRCRGRARAELAAGLNSLSNIGAVAPWLGLGATLIGIRSALNAPPCLGCCAGGISETLVTTAMGLFVGIPALAGSDYLRRQLERFDVGAARDSSDLLTRLRRFPIPVLARRGDGEFSAPTPGSTMRLPRWEIPYDRQLFVLGPVWIFGSLFLGALAIGAVRGLVGRLLH